MSICPFSCLESSPTSSHLLKPCMRKIPFSKQNLLFLKIHYRMSVKIWDYPPRRMCWRTSRNSHGPHLKLSVGPSPTPFSRKSSCEIHFTTMLVFQKTRVMHSHIIYRLPGAYECIMSFQQFSTNISICIYSQIYNYTTCNSTISIITQISSLELNTISSPMTSC